MTEPDESKDNGVIVIDDNISSTTSATSNENMKTATKKKRKRRSSGVFKEMENYFKLEAAEAKMTSLKNKITRIKERLEDDDLVDEQRVQFKSCIKKFQKQYDGLIMLEYLSTKF